MVDPAREVERLLEKGRFKDAVKGAKICWRDRATPEHHQLLERAYLLRADQLWRGAMPTAAREVAQHLLDFGVSDPALIEQASSLLIALGMIREARSLQGRIDSPEIRRRFAAQEADLAVVHPERGGGASAEVREGSRLIRAALEAVLADDDATALAAARDVARGSPFADWKLFARGLAAHRRRDQQDARANWDRLDPNRAAARIARSLLALAGARPGSEQQAVDGAAKTDALERRVFGAAVLEPLMQVRALVSGDRLREALARLSSLRQALAAVDPALAPRLTLVLQDPVVKAARQLDFREASALVKAFTQAAERPPIDPRWNRLWALIWQGPHGGFDQAADYWRRYLHDLETLPGLRPEERTLAQALVLKHLGENRIQEIDDVVGTDEGECDDAFDRAVAFLEESLAIAPDHRPTYQSLMIAYDEWDRPDSAAAVARRMLEKFPDAFDAAMLLANHHVERLEPDPALEYTRRARALKPLDRDADELEWAVHLLRARVLALQGRWDEGRAEFLEAERLQPEASQWIHTRARRAVFELKAGRRLDAQALIDQAAATLPAANPLWLALTIESIRYELPAVKRAEFEARWLVDLKKKVRGDAAGAMAELMSIFLRDVVYYPGRDRHVQGIVGYLGRTTRTKYAHDDLARVCDFLILVPDQESLWEKMVNRGGRLFPDSPMFLLLLGTLEMSKGIFRADARKAYNFLDKARRIAEASSNPAEVRLLPKIRQTLSMIDDSGAASRRSPFGFGGLPFPPGAGKGGIDDFMDFMSATFRGGAVHDDDEEEVDEDDDGFSFIPAPAKSKAGGKSKRKP